MEDESEFGNGLQPHLAVIAMANVLQDVVDAPGHTRVFQGLPFCCRIWAFPLDIALLLDEKW